MRYRHDNKLCNSVSNMNRKRFMLIGVLQNDFELTTVITVNETRSIYYRYAVLDSQTASRQYEACISFRESDCKPRGY